MKQLFIFLAIALVMSSCNTQKALTKYLADHNFQQSVRTNPVTHQTVIIASIDSLYNYSKVQEICSQSDVTFHISKGSITVYAECQAAVDKVSDLLKKLLAAVKW